MNAQVVVFLPYLVSGLAVVFAVLAAIRPRVSLPASNLPPPAERVPVDLNGALEVVLVKALDSQTTMFEKMQKLNVENATLAMEMLAKQNAKRAGKARAKTGLRKRDGRFDRNCRLCKDPMIHDPSVAEIVAHSAHRVGAHPKITEQDGAVQFHVNESEVDGDEKDRLEDDCPTCGGKHLPGQGHLFQNGSAS